MRSNRSGEYYEKFDESGQCSGPFVKFPICVQYTMSSTLYQIGVVERRNHILIDKVKKYVKLCFYTFIIVDVCIKGYYISH